MERAGRLRSLGIWLVGWGILWVMSACQAESLSTPTVGVTPFSPPESTPTLSASTPVLSAPEVTPTPSPTATPTPTLTPTPTPTPRVNVDSVPLLDTAAFAVPSTWEWFESSQGFRLAYPPDWLALDLSEADWRQLLTAVQDESLRERLDEQLQALIASQTAAFLTATVPEPGGEGFPFVSNLNVVRSRVPPTLSQEQVVEGILENLRQIPGLQVEMVNRGQIQGHPAVAALYTYIAEGMDGQAYTIVGWQVYIRTREDRLDVLTFTTLASVFATRIQDFARMAASFDTTE